MRRILLFTSLTVLWSLFSANDINAQSCVPTNLNNVVRNISCGATCTNLTFQVPHLKSTEKYAFNVIPYTPFPYVTATGAEDIALYDDDFYSQVINLPFTFCFFDSSYTRAIVGSNGVITFDENNGACSNAYTLANAIPFAGGGAICDQFATYYPRAAIMGAFSDLDPTDVESPADRKIQWRVEGTAPCRKFIVSYFHVGTFGTSCAVSVPNSNTFQMVIYESTGLIDVYIQNKSCLSSTNGGKAILGIQDWTRTKAIAAPGKNATVWNSTNQGFRFTPNGATSQFVSSELLDMNAVVLATADTATTVQGLLDISFPNICPVANLTQYVVRTTFGSCPTGTTMISLDTITVNRNTSLPTTSSFTQTTCGASVGTITVTVTPGNGTAPFSYGIDGNTPGASNTFPGLGAGPHVIYATDATGCDTTFTVIVTALSNIPATAVPVASTCPGSNNGTITVTPASGVPPFTFTLTGPGGPYTQTNPVFTGLAGGTYAVTFTDNSGCSGAVSNIVVGPGAAPTATWTRLNTSCSGARDGSITVITNPAGIWTYTLNPGNVVQFNNPVFTGLGAGTYSVNYSSPLGCSGNLNNIIITSGPVITGTQTHTNTSCAGINDGSITIIPTNPGVYTYVLNPGAITQSNPVFTGLAPNTYTATFTSALGCVGTLTNITVAAGASLTATTTTTPTSCPTRNDGTITIMPTGTGPYTFTLNPENITQSSPVFTGVAAGTHTITFSSVSGCTGTVAIDPIVTAGPYLTSSVTTVYQPVCANINDGTITIVPGGTGPYSFTLTPGATQASPTFTSLAPGPYTYNFTDANGCTGTGSFTLSSNPALRTPSVKVMPLCNGNNNGSITFNTGGGVAPYQYALAPYTAFQATNVFGGLIAGTYNFRIKDAVGCTKDTTIVLAEPAVLTASASNTKVATCNGNDGTITVTAGGGTTPYQYSINNGVNYQSPNIFTAPDTGFYANIKVKDAKGCLVNTSVTVALLDTMRLELGATQTICVESSITLQPQTNASTTIFTWTAQNVPLSTLSNPSIKNPVATPQDTAIYTLNAQWGVCKRTDNITINVLHKPIPNAGLDTAICNQATQTIPAVATLNGSATNLSGTVNYAWEPANKVSFPNQAVTPARTDSTQKFTLTVTDNYGCNFVVTDTVTVFVQPPVQAYAGRDTIAMLNRPHQLMATGGVGYLWKPAGPLNDAHLQNPLATLTLDTRFTVVVTDVAGCEGYDTVFVKAYDGPTYYVPNAFTPNGDGRNDIFRAIPSGITSTEYFRVFNRFGELLFETNQWLKGWDGTYRGKKQPIGTYVWMIKGKDYMGRVVEQKGTVLIIL